MLALDYQGILVVRGGALIPNPQRISLKLLLFIILSKGVLSSVINYQLEVEPKTLLHFELLYNLSLPSEQMVNAGKSTCDTGRAVVVTVVKTGFSCQSKYK